MSGREKLLLKNLEAYRLDGAVIDLIDLTLPILQALWSVTPQGKINYERLHHHAISPEIYEYGAITVRRNNTINIPGLVGSTKFEGTSIGFSPYDNNFAIQNKLPAVQIISAVVDQSTLNDRLKNSSAHFRLNSIEQHRREGGLMESMVIQDGSLALTFMALPDHISADPKHLGQGKIYLSRYDSIPYAIDNRGQELHFDQNQIAKLPEHQDFVESINGANQAISQAMLRMGLRI